MHDKGGSVLNPAELQFHVFPTEGQVFSALVLSLSVYLRLNQDRSLASIVVFLVFLFFFYTGL